MLSALTQIKTRIDNERYLRSHPEVDVLIGDFLRSAQVHINITKIHAEWGKNVCDVLLLNLTLSALSLILFVFVYLTASVTFLG